MTHTITTRRSSDLLLNGPADRVDQDAIRVTVGTGAAMGHRFRALTVIMVCALATLASACGPVVKNPTSLEQSAALTAPTREQLYLLSPGDPIDVRFFYNPDLNVPVTVRPD